MPTQDEIVARLQERQPEDMFGFEWHEYIAYLDFEHARPWLKSDAKAENWEHRPFDEEKLREKMKDYMAFAWEKANNCRGISAGRSIMHYIGWTWLVGDVEFSAKLDTAFGTEYQYYGKDLLRMICDQYGWDADQWDDNVRTNTDI